MTQSSIAWSETVEARGQDGSSSAAGRWKTVGRGEEAYRAFVPNPLPPAFPMDIEVVRALSEADRGVGELVGLGRMLPNPQLLLRPFVRREAVLSSRIEGTRANVRDVYAFEAGQLRRPEVAWAPDEADVHEVANYVIALEYGLERLATLPVSLRLVRELHHHLMEGVRGEHATPGEFRRSQNWIGPPGSSLANASYVPPPVAEMHEALDLLERFLHTEGELPPLVRLALMHYQFEAIHPFLDGNGRIGRLLIVLLLADWGLLPSPLLYLSAYFERERDTYLDLLRRVSERGAWRDWLLFFLRGVAEQARDAVTRAQRLQDVREGWRVLLTQGRSSATLLRLAEALFETPVISIPQAAQTLGITYRAAQLNVEKLVAAGVLTPFGRRSNTQWFAATAIIEAVESR